jgi:hypothetical protein
MARPSDVPPTLADEVARGRAARSHGAVDLPLSVLSAPRGHRRIPVLLRPLRHTHDSVPRRTVTRLAVLTARAAAADPAGRRDLATRARALYARVVAHIEAVGRTLLELEQP